MLRYFFDWDDSGEHTPDDVGVELRDLEAARRIAAQSLGELATDVLPSCTERHIAITVRDEAGRTLLVTEITFAARVTDAGTTVREDRIH